MGSNFCPIAFEKLWTIVFRNMASQITGDVSDGIVSLQSVLTSVIKSYLPYAASVTLPPMHCIDARGLEFSPRQ